MPWEVARLPPYIMRVDELGDERAVVERVRQNLTTRDQSTTWHPSASPAPRPPETDNRRRPRGHGVCRSRLGVRLRPNDRPASRILTLPPCASRGPDLPDRVSPAIPPERLFSTPPPGARSGRRDRSRPGRSPYALGRFAPYLLRLRLRPCTPTASRVPRTMW